MALTLSVIAFRSHSGAGFAHEVWDTHFPESLMTTLWDELTAALQRFQQLFDPTSINAR